ncbi:Polyamine transporter TPO5 [Talaromyces islandicus]|uniref:Polyamine transporter TPO5 n=1 Tax=Talaromyces islandicus TaxID=28573 RepID=A0A0U1LW58_TALIS|nr:Polyamine transporter TPO5 [Talaromyces islandicus]
MDSSSAHGGTEGLKNIDSNAPKAKVASNNDIDNYGSTTKRPDAANTSELVKNRSTLQVAFMSFVLASIPYGLSTTFIYPLYNGGPVTIIWGWLAVSLIIICVAASLGEITSVYPTAGGVYYQTFMLSPPRWRKLAAWTCGWAYVAGNILITLAVNFGSTTFIVGCINVFESEIGIGTLASETYQQFLIFTFAIFWTFFGVIATVACILALAKHGRHSGGYVFGHFEPLSGWTSGWAFCVGLLQAAYATSSTGMIISMCEEVRNPSVQVPKAMVGAVILNTLAGLLFLIPMVVVLPELNHLVSVASGQPVPVILKSAVGNAGGAFALLIPLIVLALLCGIGCTTATSRCVWAFARDGAMPGSYLWDKVNKSLNTPFNAMMLSMVVQIALGLIYFGSATAFNAFSSAGVIFLTVSYAVPIAASLFSGRKQVKTASFNLGAGGVFCNVVSLGWTLLAVPLFCMPTTLPVSATTINYACVVFVAVIIIAAGWYWIWGHQNYQGPLVDGIPVPVEHMVDESHDEADIAH